MGTTRLLLATLAFAPFLLTPAQAGASGNSPASVNNAAFYTLPTFSVKLTQGGSLRATIVLMGATAAQIEPKLPQITDALNGYLKDTKPTELAGPGMEAIKQGILARINPIISPAAVSMVMFKEMIVQ